MKKLIALLLALCLTVLCGCAKAPESTTPTGTTAKPAPTKPATPPTTPPATTKPTETEPAPSETIPPESDPVIVGYNPLTGEPMTELSENRPVAIVLNNIKAAMPQHGISHADVLIEVLAEGGITRCLGIFSDVSKAEAFGSIRSARPYLIQMAQSFDAIFVHAGASAEGKEYLKSGDCDNLDGVYGSGASKYFYRDKDRLNSGYSQEHTLFIKPDSILAYAQKLGYPTTREGGVDFGWSFGDSSAAVGEAATSVTLYFGSGSSSKSTSLGYNVDTGLYEASQHGTAHVDGATDRQMAYRNILVLNTSVTKKNSNSNLLTIATTGSGTGHYACDGKIIPIKWSRASVNDPFVFTTEDGEPITLGVGKTYLAVVPTNALLKHS